MAVYMCTQKQYDRLASEYGTKARACAAIMQNRRLCVEITDIKVHQVGKGHRLPGLNRDEARRETQV